MHSGVCAALAGLCLSQAAAQTPESLSDLLCGQTIHVYYGIGNQVEYLAADGTSYFWHPNMDMVIEGRWRIGIAATGGEQICFQYMPDALRDGSTGDEFCLAGEWFISTFLEDGLRPGDPYNLQSGTPHFALPAQPPLNMEELSKTFPDQPQDTNCGAILS